MNDTWKVTAQGASAGLLLDKVHANIHECMHAQLLTNLLLCMHTHTRARARAHTHTNTETDTHKRTHRYSHTRTHTGVSFHGACWVSAGYICHGIAVASGRKRGEFHPARARAHTHTHIHIPACLHTHRACPSIPRGRLPCPKAHGAHRSTSATASPTRALPHPNLYGLGLRVLGSRV